MEPRAVRAERMESPGAVFCVLEADAGYEMHRSTCPDGQFWLCARGSWSIQREGDSQARPVTYYAPKEPCRRIAEQPTRAVGLQIRGPLLAKIAPRPSEPMHSVAWEQTSAVILAAHLSRSGRLDAESLECLVSEIPFGPVFESTLGNRLDQVRDLVCDSDRETLDLSQISAVVMVSPSHLCRAFRARFGVSISRYRRRIRLERTLDIYRLVGGSIYDAAIEAGFFDASHFYRTVAQELGLRPADLAALGQPRSRTDGAIPYKISCVENRAG